MSANSWVLENSGGIAFGVCMALCVLFYLTCSRWPRRVSGTQDEAGSAASDDGGELARAAHVAVDVIPSFPYKHENADVDGAGGGSVQKYCVVCLNQVAEGEMVRLLPKCKHLFHVGCIDMWLRSHSKCPLCRSDAAKQPRAAEVAEERGVASILPPPPV